MFFAKMAEALVLLYSVSFKMCEKKCVGKSVKLK